MRTKYIKIKVNDIYAGTFYYCTYEIDTKHNQYTLVIRHDNSLIYCIAFDQEVNIVENDREITINITK